MPLDPSIILGGTPPANPLQQFGQIASTINELNQNKLFQGRTAAGRLAQQAIGPDGQFDQAKFQNLLANDPRAAPFAQEALSTSLSQGGAQIANQRAMLEKQAVQSAALQARLGRLPLGATSQDAAGVIALAAQQGVIDPAMAATTAGSLPQDWSAPVPMGRDAKGNPVMSTAGQQFLNNNFKLPDLGAQGALNAVAPTPTLVNTGGKTQEVTLPQMGTPAVVGSLTNTESPADKLGRVSYTGPDGVQHTVPQGAITTETGEPKQVAGITGPHGEMTGSLAPGVGEAQTAAAVGSAAQLNAFRQDVQGSGGRVLTLQKALTGLQGAGDTGPGTATVQNAKSFLLSMAPDWLKNTLGITPEEVQKITSYDEANKYLTQVAIQQSGQFGSATDAKLASAITGNASTHISNLAAQDVTKVNIALERAKQVEMAQFDKTGLRPDQWSDWAAKWGSGVDPRAFMLDMQTPQERKKMIDGMSKLEKAHFYNGLKAAHDAGTPGIAELVQ